MMLDLSFDGLTWIGRITKEQFRDQKRYNIQVISF